MSIVPYSVPNEIVETGIFCSAASLAAVNDPRGSFSPSGPGTVCLPSLINTIRAGGGPSSPTGATGRGNEATDARPAQNAPPGGGGSDRFRPAPAPFPRDRAGGG